jgi:RNA polymerase sigma factor (sigma-70 family)
VLRLAFRSPRSDPPAADGPVHDELAALAVAVRNGDPAALRTFVTSIVPDLIRVVRRVLGVAHPEVEDTAYEAAYAVVEGLGEFRGESTFRYFASRVAVMTAMNVRRKESAVKRSAERDYSDPDAFYEDGPNPEEMTASASLTPVVRNLVGTLPAPLSEALTLHVILGYTVGEIAAASGAPLETVRSRLRLAKQALRKAVLRDPKLREVFEVDP